MAAVRIRFAEADRAKYGDGWYEIDPNNISDPRLTAGLIERWEDATGYTLMLTLGAALLRGEHRAVRALMWLAILADGSQVEWVDFWPEVRSAEMVRPESGDQGNRPSPAEGRATGGTGRSTGRRSASTSTTTN